VLFRSLMYQRKENDARWRQIIDNNMPGGGNYREFVFKHDNPRVDYEFTSDHFPKEKNYLAHALVRDRKFEDGSNTLHIDELQSDLHQQGSKYGYRTPDLEKRVDDITNTIWDDGKDILTDIKKEIKKVKSLESSNKPDSFEKADLRFTLERLQDTELSLLKLYRFDKSYVKEDVLDRSTETIDWLESRLMRINEPSGYLGDTKSFYEMDRKLLEKVENYRDNINEKTRGISKAYKMGNPPFKETWHQLSIKKLLKRAVDEGYDNLSLSNSKPISERYEGTGEEGKELFYDRKAKNYMQKLAKSTGGEFKIKYLKNDIFNYTPDDSDMRSYVIEITPELKELVSTKGLASFRKGGKVSTNSQMDRLGFNEGTIFGTVEDTLKKASRVAADTVEKLKTERQEPSPEDTQRVNNFLAKHYDRFTTQYPELSDISFEQFKNSAQRLAANVRKIESDNRNVPLGGNNAGSSATGKYQFLRDSVEPAINRTLRRVEPQDKNIFDSIRENKDTSKLNDEAQQLLFFGDIFEKTGSDKHLVPYFLGDEQAGKNVYLYQHHTLSSKVPEYNQETIDRTNKLWNSPE